MTPERISLSGFLCYRDAQSADFDGQSLWMLSGPNGSGKSSLFDAITFALYGIHRDGKHNAERLINRNSDGLTVEFDFLIDGARFRAHRTLRRQGKPTRRLLRWIAETGWEEIPETSGQAGFDRWVHENVGLSEDTFRASVMLRQGEADRILTLKPADRHRFLGEIVGLDRYERLHAQADDRRKQASFAANNFASQLKSLPAVTPEMLDAAQQTRDDVAQAVEQAAADVQRLTEQGAHAATWHALDERLGNLLIEDDRLDELLSAREAILSRAERFELLEQSLAPLEACVELRKKQVTADARRKALCKQEQAQSEERSRQEEVSSARSTAIDKCETDLESLESLHGERTKEHVGLVAVVPVLTNLCHERQTIQTADANASHAREKLLDLHEKRETATQSAPPPAALPDAEQALGQAESHAGAATGKREDAHARRSRFQEVQTERSCPYCGQGLPHEHVESEAARLDRECEQAVEAERIAQANLKKTRKIRDELRQKSNAAEKTIRDLDREIHKHDFAAKNAAEQQQSAAERFHAHCLLLPEELRRRTETDAEFPSCLDVKQFDDRKTSLSDEIKDLAASISKLKTELKRLRDEAAKEDKLRGDFDTQSQKLQIELSTTNNTIQHLQDSLATTAAAIPEPWRVSPETHLEPLRKEHRELQQADVAGQRVALQDAQTRRDQLAGNLAEIRGQIETVPLAARRDPAEVEADLKLAKTSESDCRQQLSDADTELQTLLQTQSRRQSLDADARLADRRQHLWRRLADLLGRQGLQRHLVRTAERQIVEYADAILDRLSAGDLHLELAAAADDEQETALDLAARSGASPQPVDVPFLSGSQRFRVAVALSLAIGQYASHTRRPVRSVIIDEGFGCLDAENRQTMIQELHNLRQHLDRIILVTHQDDIAQAFPHGYHCQPQAGATQLIPFHR